MEKQQKWHQHSLRQLTERSGQVYTRWISSPADRERLEDIKNKGLKITLHCMSKQSNSRQRQGFRFVSSGLYWHASHVLVAPPRKSMAETEREERVSKCRRLVTDPCLLMDKEQYALHYAGNKTHHKYNVDTFSWLTCSKLRRYEYTQQKLTDN